MDRFPTFVRFVLLEARSQDLPISSTAFPMTELYFVILVERKSMIKKYQRGL